MGQGNGGAQGAGEAEGGVLVVDKPRGVTSFDVVAALRRALHVRRVGHAGTLDPMATGVLVVGFGRATRLLPYITGDGKTYETTIRLGQATDTDDADGVLVPRTPSEADQVARIIEGMGEDDIREAASHLTGRILQTPSAYSAKRVNGRKAYDLARSGQDVALGAVPVTIGRFDIDSISRREAAGAPVIDVDARIDCSAGTYIRALGRDMGRALKVGGHLTMLRRTRVGGFAADSPIVVRAHSEVYTARDRSGGTIERTRAILEPEDRESLLNRALTPAQAAHLAMPTMEIDHIQADALAHGRSIGTSEPVRTATAAIATLGGQETLVAIVESRTATAARPTVVFAPSHS